MGESAGEYSRLARAGRGSATGDLDGDGDMDLVVNNAGGAPALLVGESERGHWITLRLIGRGADRDEFGARLAARAGGRTRRRWVRGGGSYLSVSDRRVHFGLGEARAVETIEIVWPLGTKQVLENVPADRFLEVSEPEK